MVVLRRPIVISEISAVFATRFMKSNTDWRTAVSRTMISSIASATRIGDVAGCAFVISRSLPPSLTTKSAGGGSATGAPRLSGTVTNTVRSVAAVFDVADSAAGKAEAVIITEAITSAAIVTIHSLVAVIQRTAFVGRLTANTNR